MNPLTHDPSYVKILANKINNDPVVDLKPVTGGKQFSIRIDYLTKENKRLREALKQIEYLDRPQNRGLPRRVSIHEIALAALKEEE